MDDRWVADRPIDTTVSLSAVANERRPYLLLVERDTSSLVLLPDAGALLIGRAPEAQIRTDDVACSRRHAEIVSEGDGIVVRDLGSHNGTRINGRTIEGTQPVDSGDVISIGELVIVVHRSDAARLRKPRLDPRAFGQRVAEELQRCIDHDRAACVVAIALGDDAHLAMEEIIEPELRAMDSACLGPDHHALLLLPEIDGELAAERVARMVQSCAAQARAGIACCPTDGSRAELLLVAARAAAAVATPGAVVFSADNVSRLTIGSRSAIVADPAMAQLFKLIGRLADSDLPVLIVGETGVGKENAAQALHAWSRRADKPLVALNCAALQETLAESELFGHERGAFSGAVATSIGKFEAAEGGTLFFDEIGELPLRIQVKILRALESKSVARVGATKERAIDVRFVAATNRDLEAEVAAGRFREDLYFRLRGARIALPPLRDRPREIAILTRAFLEEACRAHGRETMVFSASAMDALARYPWPGNIRELKNEMEYVAATADGVIVEPWQLSERLLALPDAPTPDGASPQVPPVRFRPLADELRDLERRRMSEALGAAGGVQKRAAELIAMPLRTFRMKAKLHGLDRRR